MNSSGFMQVGAQQGWQCPICKRVLSPWTVECPCMGQGMGSITITSTPQKSYDITYPHFGSVTKGMHDNYTQTTVSPDLANSVTLTSHKSRKRGRK